MDNRLLVGLGIVGLLVIILLNVFPFLWVSSPAKYIEQDQVRGMALIHRGRPYTFNFDQQRRTVDILNRAIPVGTYRPTPKDPVIDFSAIEIYRFQGETVRIEPLAWVDRNLVFKAPIWSTSFLMEVSGDELYQIVNGAYDKNLPTERNQDGSNRESSS